MKHLEVFLSDEHRSNLRKHAIRMVPLAEIMEKEINFDFDMSRFCERHGPVCGTAGCSLGFATYTIGPREGHKETRSWLEGEYRYNYEDYMAFGYRIFGLSDDDDDNVDDDQSFAWEWCFSEKWAGADPSVKGAAQRILYMLERGVPDNWYEQMMGGDVISYTRIEIPTTEEA